MNVLFVSFLISALLGPPVGGEKRPELKGLRLYGASESLLPVAGLRSDPITIEFDIKADEPPNLQLRFQHCDRDWKVTETSFVNDEFYDRTKTELPYVAAPSGIKGYSYHYQVRVPDKVVLKEFRFSGNHRLEIWEVDRGELLASARFFVADGILRPAIKVANRQEPSEVNPYYQVHRIDVSFAIPPPDSVTSYFTHDFLAVDIYKNREIYRPWSVGADDRDPHTFVEGFGTQALVFRIDNIPPGAEYRVLNLENVDHYPQDRLLRQRGGVDMSRFLLKAPPDNNGSSSFVRGSVYAEYLDFEFELWWDGNGGPVYVVGDFNQWEPGREPMQNEDGRYKWRTSLRRGRYDYQYVAGNDWVVLEGNDWKTINQYTALVYYRDPRFGGFDRVLGVARAKSPGDTSARSN